MNAYDLLVTRGGSALWQLRALPNGGFFLVPQKKDPDQMVHVQSPNGYSADLSLDGSGIVATLFALGELRLRGNRPAENAYYKLERYAWQCADAEKIIALID